MMTRLLGLFSTLILLSSSASAATPSSQTLKVRLPFEPATLDWNLGDVPILVVQNTMRGLYRVDTQGKVVPDLVVRSKTLSGGTLWRLELEPTAKWSDDVPFTAEHAEASLKRLLDPKTGSSYATFLYDIQGARAVNQNKASPETLGIKAVSKGVLEIRLEKPAPYLPAILTHWVTYPVRPDLLARHPDLFTRPAGKLATLGAYRITEFQRETRIRLEANPHALRKPRLERVEAWIVPDDNTALNLYDAGKLHFMTDPGIGSARSQDRISRPSPIVYFLGVGKGHPLVESQAGVQALSLALERKEIPVALGAPHRPTEQYCPPEICRFAANAPIRSDLARARELLKKAGFGPGKAPPPLTLHYFNRPAIAQLAEWLQAQWKRNLGITVLLEGQEPKTYWSTLGAKPVALFVNSKGASYPDPDTFFQLFTSENPQNLGRWKDAEYDAWVREASTSASAPTRARLYGKASDRLLMEKPALIPLYFRSTEYLIKPGLKGVVINPLTSVDLSLSHF